jgi:TPP-dependent indolepyruvate ferredoxin oxidoreductase alpha subunit
VLTGAEALAHALTAARLRRIWSFPGSPLGRLHAALDGQKNPLHRYAVNEPVAVSLALGGALLAGNGTAVTLRQGGVAAALEVLETFGLTNELRAPCLLVEGVDAGARAADTAHDHRGPLADGALLAQLEAGAPDDLYHLTRLGCAASAKTGMMIALRASARALDTKANVSELPPDRGDAPLTWSRAGGPHVCARSTFAHHVAKRGRRLEQLQPLVDALTVQTGAGDRGAGVIIAGHLGAWAQARAWSRRLPTLRLGAAWPLPRRTLIEFLRARPSVLVLEEGQPFLERAVGALCQREGIGCRVVGAGGPRPGTLDDERLENTLTRFGGRIRAESEPQPRDSLSWKRAADAVNAIAADDGEPWPLFLARTRGQLEGFAANDPRLSLLKALRGLERPTILAAGPGPLARLALKDKLIDVKMHFGSAAPIAGALAEATEMEERAGSGAPLAVALIGDTAHYHSELNGLLDNAIARREVLHVLLVHRRSDAQKLPALPDDALETQLRSAGLHVATAQLDDPGLSAAVAYAASRSGPRALVCYAPAALSDLEPGA